jgi:hypothetical protein
VGRLAGLVLALGATIACGISFRPLSGPLAGTCHADYFEHYASLAMMVDRAETVVRGRVRGTGVTDEGYGSLRTITLRAEETMKGDARGEITIVEGPCPDLDVREGDEWVAFLMRYASQRTSRDAGKYVSISGPQGIFPLPSGKVSAVNFDPAAPPTVVMKYAGKTTAELVRDIKAIAPLDIAAQPLFARYGWTVTRPWQVQEITIPSRSEWGLPRRMGFTGVERPFGDYASASADGGYDLASFEGRPAELLALTLERDWDGNGRFPPLGHVLIVDRRIVGLWVLISPQGDVYSARQRDAALAAPPRDPPTPSPSPNRFPAGVNIARQYDLANATRIFVKRIDRPAEITDRTRIAEIAAALDTQLPTDIAAPLGNVPWVVFIYFGERYERFLYRADLDRLTHIEDGFSVHPPRLAIELLDAAGR